MIKKGVEVILRPFLWREVLEHITKEVLLKYLRARHKDQKWDITSTEY